ncbi:MAG TPA: class I SAM-dependent methyltransferase [Candidatus Baltobacteraceae bacterium]|nr:class I SAM-dependent methyltransferase [Candidatus Baltobacteraceae bacterium]
MEWRSQRPKAYVFSPEWLNLRENFRNVEDALDRVKSGRLLDLGCGSKPFRRPGIDWVGFDVEGNPFADAVGSATNLPFADGSFDHVLSTQVLEHVDDPQRMLTECARVLRPGGTLILSAPQYWELHEEPHDYFRFTEHGLRVLLHRAGFVVGEIRREGCGVKLAALAFNSAIAQIGGLPNPTWLKALKAPVYLAVNVATLLLALVLPNRSDVQNYTLVASRAGRTEGDPLPAR